MKGMELPDIFIGHKCYVGNFGDTFFIGWKQFKMGQVIPQNCLDFINLLT